MSKFCMNCGEQVEGTPTGTPWRDVPVFLYCDDGVDGNFEGVLWVLECPFCGHQQIDFSGQYENLPMSEEEEDDQESE